MIRWWHGTETREAAVNRYINIYELDQHYGGPEEGGWWYDSGTPVYTMALPEGTEEDAALAAVDALREVYRYEGRLTKSRYPHDGYDYSVVLEDEPAKAYPESRPYYE